MEQAFLELRQYENDSMESMIMFVLKLPLFFTRLYCEEKRAVISKLSYIWTPSSRYYIGLALAHQRDDCNGLSLGFSVPPWLDVTASRLVQTLIVRGCTNRGSRPNLFDYVSLHYGTSGVSGVVLVVFSCWRPLLCT